MGIPFPLGIKNLEKTFPADISWMWCLNSTFPCWDRYSGSYGMYFGLMRRFLRRICIHYSIVIGYIKQKGAEASKMM